MKKYVLLTGAKCNVGDFLIVDRAKKLLQAHCPHIELVDLPRWKPLENNVKYINSAEAVILCGGPAYQPHFYPGIYPLVEDLDRIKVPMIPFGLGWKGFPGDEATVQSYTFARSSLKLLRKIHDGVQITSCRDYLTKRVLARHGFQNVVMTGDPAWYDLDYIGESFSHPQRINTIVFSVPARDIYYLQSIHLVVALRKLFNKAKIICAFHHGWELCEGVSSRQVEGFKKLREGLRHRGFDTISLASDLRRMEEVYGSADLHIGYRLHAHLFFLSRRKPSFLLEEDGRGRAASEALGLRGIQAWSKRMYTPLIARVSGNRYTAALLTRIFGKPIMAHDHAIDEMIALIGEELENGFRRFAGLDTIIDSTYSESMGRFLRSVFSSESA